MALRSLMLNKSITEKRSALAELEAIDFVTREAEIATSIEEAQSDEERSAVEEAITAFETEKADTETKKENLRSEIAALEAELADIEAAAPAETGEAEKPVERKDDKMMNDMEVRSSKAYIDAFVDYIKTEDDTQCRSLLTENASGTVPVPVYVENRVRTAWEKNEILSLVRKTYMKGNVKVGFEVSATGAAIHTEGESAPNEETLVLGIYNMVPASLKKWITISDEAVDMGGEEFLDYIYDELTYQIALLLGQSIVNSIAAAPTGQTYSAGNPAPQATIADALAIDTVANAIAELSDEAVNPVCIMSKGTWALFKAAQYNGNYNIDPFEGLQVIFSSALQTYDASDEGETYLIVGDLNGAQVNFPNGEEFKIKYDDMSLAEADMVKVVGRLYAALGVVTPYAFCRVTVPEA